MKLSLALFSGFCLVVLLCMLILSGKAIKTSAEDNVVNICTGNKACLHAAASIVGQSDMQAVNQPTSVPSGYCLHVPVLLYHHVQPQADAVAKGQTSLTVDSAIFDGQM